MTDRSRRKSINGHGDEQNEPISNTNLSNLENRRDNNYSNPLPAVHSRSFSEHSKDSINVQEPNETTSLLEGTREPSSHYSHFPSAREDDNAFRLLLFI